MGTPKQFSLQLKKFDDLVDEQVEDLMVFLGFDLWNRITKNTPRLTGRAAGSWNIQAGAPDLSVLPPAPNGQENFYVLPLVPIWAYKFPQKIWITNNLDYIIPLEEGHSRKVTPPAGRMVRLSVQETAEIAKIKGLL